MELISPIKLNLAKRLKEDKEFRNRFFHARAQDEVASSIIDLRKKRKMRQIDLAKHSGMKQSAVSRIEQADYSGWSFTTLQRVAESLDARVRIIFEPIEDVIKFYEQKEAVSTAEPQTQTITVTGIPPSGQVSGSFVLGQNPVTTAGPPMTKKISTDPHNMKIIETNQAYEYKRTEVIYGRTKSVFV